MDSIQNINFKNKKVFVRVDFNVPLNESLQVADSTRIESAIPTLKFILKNGGSCIVASHLGRPKGISKAQSLKNILPSLELSLGQRVKFLPQCVGKETHEVCSMLRPGEVVLLENLRFFNEETVNNDNFAQNLASLADIYINDAFGTTHRKHASTHAITKYFSLKAPGFLLQAEISALNKFLKTPRKPVTAIIGGAKVSSKISVIKNILKIADNIIIGGGMSYTFIKGKGGQIGKSIFEPELIMECNNILKLAQEKGVNIILAKDVYASKSFADHKGDLFEIDKIPNDYQGMDVGPKTLKIFDKLIKSSKTILWNGPMGVFEFSNYELGTKSIALSVAEATESGAFSLVGGGDSVAALKKFKLFSKVSYISTGGGAMLESLEGRMLPGIKALNLPYERN